jgi:predicted MFS family arabinose efflux permease
VTPSSTSAASRSPWRSRDFRLVWGGGLVNDLGDWLLIIALPVYVFGATSSGMATALLFLVEMAPAVLLGSVAGAFVDRWDLRRTIVTTNLLQAVALLPLLFVTSDRVWPAFLVAGAQAVLTRFNNPAVGALVPRLVDPDQLGAANAATSVSNNLSRLVGSPLGGIVVEFGGLRTVALVDGLSFLMVAFATSRVRASAGRLDEPRSADSSTAGPESGGAREGFRIIRRTRPLPTLLATIALSQFAQGLFLVLFIAFVVRDLGGSGAEVGLLRGVQALGGVTGGLLLGRYARHVAPGLLIGWGFLTMGLVALATWNAPSITTSMVLYMFAFALAGVPAVAGGIGTMTAMQMFTPPPALGRVIGTGEAVAAAGNAAGVLVAGATIDAVGVRPMLDVQATTYIVCGLLGLAVVSRARPVNFSDLFEQGVDSGEVDSYRR